MNLKTQPKAFQNLIMSISLAGMTILASCLSFGAGGTDGGGKDGGGGLAYQLQNGKYVTLPEFGVLIADSVEKVNTTGKIYPKLPTYFQITDQDHQEVNKIQAKIFAVIPSFKIPGEIFPEKKRLISKLDVDPVVYEKIKAEYGLVLKAFGYAFDEQKAVLPAYSENGITYILPDFLKLEPVQRAKYLIHEAQMRSGNTSNRVGLLVETLKMDTLIEQIAFPKDAKSLNIYQTLQRLTKLNLIKGEDVFHQVFLTMLNESGGEVNASEFIEDLNCEEGIDNVCEFRHFLLNPSYIQDMQTRHHLTTNYAEIFKDTTLSFNFASVNFSGKSQPYNSQESLNQIGRYSSGNDSRRVDKYCFNHADGVFRLVPETSVLESALDPQPHAQLIVCYTKDFGGKPERQLRTYNISASYGPFFNKLINQKTEN